MDYEYLYQKYKYKYLQAKALQAGQGGDPPPRPARRVVRYPSNAPPPPRPANLGALRSSPVVPARPAVMTPVSVSRPTNWSSVRPTSPDSPRSASRSARPVYSSKDIVQLDHIFKELQTFLLSLPNRYKCCYSDHVEAFHQLKLDDKERRCVNRMKELLAGAYKSVLPISSSSLKQYVVPFIANNKTSVSVNEIDYIYTKHYQPIIFNLFNKTFLPFVKLHYQLAEQYHFQCKLNSARLACPQGQLCCNQGEGSDCPFIIMTQFLTKIQLLLRELHRQSNSHIVAEDLVKCQRIGTKINDLVGKTSDLVRPAQIHTQRDAKKRLSRKFN